MKESSYFNQQQRPLFAALKQHGEKEQFSFHVPGHKNGLNWIDEMAVFRDVLKFDQTEVTGLDYLHESEGVLKESQDLLTDFYQSQQSYYLVNGSTVGNLAMIMGTTTKGGSVFVDRNVHQSIIHGLELNGLQPIFLAPEIDVQNQSPVGISLETLRNAFMRYPTVEALILTYPTYDGAIYPIKELLALAKEYKCITLVDEAHGAHFVVAEKNREFPMSALAYGADIVVQSAHKMLPALTQGAYLHIGTSLSQPHKKRVEHYLHMFQSSSPSYLLMLSLEYARWFVANLTVRDSEASCELVRIWAKWFQQHDLKVSFCDDPLKLIVASDRLNGSELSQVIESVGLFPELADEKKILLTFPLIKVEQMIDFQPNDNSLVVPDKKKSLQKFQKIERLPSYPGCTNLAIDYGKQQELETEKLDWEMCLNRVSAKNIIPYPPGVPLVLKGERVAEEQLKQLHVWHNQKARIVGLDDKAQMEVYCEEV